MIFSAALYGFIAVFTTLYFLFNLGMDPMSVLLQYPGKARQGETLKLMGPIFKIQEKRCVNTAPGAVLTTLNFLCNL